MVKSPGCVGSRVWRDEEAAYRGCSRGAPATEAAGGQPGPPLHASALCQVSHTRPRALSGVQHQSPYGRGQLAVVTLSVIQDCCVFINSCPQSVLQPKARSVGCCACLCDIILLRLHKQPPQSMMQTGSRSALAFYFCKHGALS